MIFLYHPQNHPQASDWKNTLEELTVGHKLVATDTTEPYLREGKKEVKGDAAINAFLSEYKPFMSGWNQDRCDMWFFDE